jgi:hypothetical protein
MSGLLFLAGVGGFVLIITWAFTNDGMKPEEFGSGLLAMRMAAAAKQKTVPKWKKSALSERPLIKAPRQKDVPKPRWRQTFLHGKRKG